MLTSQRTTSGFQRPPESVRCRFRFTWILRRAASGEPSGKSERARSSASAWGENALGVVLYDDDVVNIEAWCDRMREGVCARKMGGGASGV